MPTSHIINLYRYNELDDKAKERALNWFRQQDYPDDGWWTSTIEDAIQILSYLGFETEEKNVQFSGFYSQGDGASFTGTWTSTNVNLELARQYAPDTPANALSTKLIKDLEDWLGGFSAPFTMEATITRISRQYSHPYTVSISLSLYDDAGVEISPAGETEQDFVTWCRDLMTWIYRQLEHEYEYLTSDEYCAETIEGNDYTFLVSGHRFEPPRRI